MSNLREYGHGNFWPFPSGSNTARENVFAALFWFTIIVVPMVIYWLCST